MRLPSTMNHSFSRVPKAEIPRSSFDRSHGLKTTFNEGSLIPILVDEVLPGDTYSVDMTGFCRMTTPLVPYMDNVQFNTFFFFVPNRLIWSNWEKFNGEQTNPGDSTDYLVPVVTTPGGGFTAGSLFDYFGVPTLVPNITVSALWSRAYNLIWNEWFRDQNLQASISVPLNDGPDTASGFTIRKRGKRHDYFTSSLPWPQKGESVSIPLGTTAPVSGIASTATTGWSDTLTGWETGGGSATAFPIARTATDMIFEGTGPSTGDAVPSIYADLTEATAATINQLRQAFQVQRLYERDARGGTRYTEIVRSHFGVVSPDARLQRPEYLGGGQSQVDTQIVPQSSATSYGGAGSTPLGALGAYSQTVLRNHGFSKSFTEHGVIIGLVSVRADMTYQQGLNRMWSRRQRFDFYWPALSHIGEQAVLSKEIFADGTAADEDVWGYQERYAEYRYKPSIVTGEMRSNYPQSLDIWHLAYDFATRPVLGATFIEEAPPIDRIVAVPSEPHFIGDFYFRMRCARPMPVYGVPGMMDHF